MSGTYPTSPGYTAINLKSNTSAFVDTTESGKTQIRSMGRHLWEFTVTHPPMTQAVGQPIRAFVESQKGRGESFQFTWPIAGLGVLTGTPTVSGAHTAGDTTINTTGWTASQTGIIKAGDLLKFANHSKVYMCVADANSGSGAGASTITIEPPLIEALVNTEGVTVSSVPFTVRMKSGMQTYKIGMLYYERYEFDAIEVIT